jgi:dipeptidyl aminopeptidase/acylaminoacyl peptidase
LTAAALLLPVVLLVAGCTSVPATLTTAEPRASARSALDLAHAPLDASGVRLSPEPLAIEHHWLLDLYDRLRPGDYRRLRVEFRGSDGEPGVAHLLLPNAPGPHPAVLVFPILDGSRLVSEALAKALANRGYAVLAIERPPLFPRERDRIDASFEAPAHRLRGAILDARRLLDWLETRPEIDRERLACAGVSVGGILAATLMGVDERIRAGFFVMAGGGLPELLYDSTEAPLVRFRERLFEEIGDSSREAFVERVRPHTQALDPLTWAPRIAPDRVLLVSGRFDRVVPPARTEALWRALGRPEWVRFPAGHYQLLPFFWWSVGRGADLLDRALVR